MLEWALLIARLYIFEYEFRFKMSHMMSVNVRLMFVDLVFALRLNDLLSRVLRVLSVEFSPCFLLFESFGRDSQSTR